MQVGDALYSPLARAIRAGTIWMTRMLQWHGILPLAVLLIVAAFYLWPVPRPSFDVVYASVDRDTTASLRAFRQAHPARGLVVDSATWDYVALGQGSETILFLHGMTGAHDIWWQQLEALQDQYRVIAVTYPAVDSLGAMARAVFKILAVEGIDRFHVVGSSLGGYFAQFLVAQHPERIQSAVFANTFPPNDLIAEKNKTAGALLLALPEWLVMNILRGSIQQAVYPASNHSKLVLAYGVEQTYGRMSKAQVRARFRCVVQRFEAAGPGHQRIPLLIIEADNDPLVEASLREQLKATYPSAKVHTFSGAGHFPYLSEAGTYSQLLREFLAAP